MECLKRRKDWMLPAITSWLGFERMKEWRCQHGRSEERGRVCQGQITICFWSATHPQDQLTGKDLWPALATLPWQNHKCKRTKKVSKIRVLAEIFFCRQWEISWVNCMNYWEHIHCKVWFLAHKKGRYVQNSTTTQSNKLAKLRTGPIWKKLNWTILRRRKKIFFWPIFLKS